MGKNTDLKIISLWMIVSVIFVVFSGLQSAELSTPLSIFLGILLGIPVVLFFPGYILTATLFPKKDDLNVIDRIALSIGTSIAIIILLGLLLSFVFEISSISIVTILCVYMIVSIVIVIVNREKLEKLSGKFSLFSVEFDKNYLVNCLMPKCNPILSVMVTSFLILAIGSSYYTIITPKIGERFTEFYILDPYGTDEYPTNLSFSNVILIGTANHERAPVNYTVQTVLEKTILSSENFVLNNDEVWEKNVSINLQALPVQDTNKVNMELKFLLFKNDNLTTPYRSLHLWVSP